MNKIGPLIIMGLYLVPNNNMGLFLVKLTIFFLPGLLIFLIIPKLINEFGHMVMQTNKKAHPHDIITKLKCTMS